MPWTVEDPPDVAKNWTDAEIEKCVAAANSTLEDAGTDEEAIFACIAAAGRSKEKADTFTCECLDCGHTVESEEHCIDINCPECGGEMRRLERPGRGQEGSAVEKADQTEREKLRKQRDARAKQYNIAVKEDSNLTPPKGYPTDASDYGDPVNYRYPIDQSHILPAKSYFNQESQREDGGYTSAEWAIIGKRIASRASSLLDGSYSYSGGKVEKKETKKAEGVSLDEQVQNIRDAWYAHRRMIGADVPNSGQYSWVKEVYEDHVIIDGGEAGPGLWRYDYAVGDEGQVTFSNPQEVEIRYEVVREMKGLLSQIKEIPGQIREALAHLLPQQKIPPSVAPALARKGFAVFRDKATKRRRWVGAFASTAYPDRDKEGFTTEVLEEAIAHAREKGTPATAITEEGGNILLDVWHLVPAVVAETDMDALGMCGHFGLATGLETGKRGKAFFDYVEEHQEDDDFDWRMSWLFLPTEKDGDGLFSKGVRILRFTVAPAEFVMNPVTGFAVAGGDEMKIEKGVRARFVEIFGEDDVARMETELEEVEAKAVEAGFVFKMEKAEVEADPPAESAPAETEPPTTDASTETPPEEPPEPQTVEQRLEALEAALAKALQSPPVPGEEPPAGPGDSVLERASYRPVMEKGTPGATGESVILAQRINV